MKWICIKEWNNIKEGTILTDDVKEYTLLRLPIWAGVSDLYRNIHFIPYNEWLALERQRKIDELLE